MTVTNRDKTRANYDMLSRWYDWLAGSGEEKAQQVALALLNGQPGERVLEIGFGTGRTLRALAQSVYPGGTLFGVDLSGGMCRVAQRKIRQTKLENICLCQADAANLPFRAHSFDALLISFTLELFTLEEIPLVLQLCREILQANGRLCITAMSDQGQKGLMMRWYQWANRQFPDVIDCRPIDIYQLLQEADFAILQTSHLSMWGLPIALVLAQPVQA